MRHLHTTTRGAILLVAIATLTLVFAAGCDRDRHHIRYSSHRYYSPARDCQTSVIVVPRSRDRSWDRHDRPRRRYDRRDDWCDNRGYRPAPRRDFDRRR